MDLWNSYCDMNTPIAQIFVSFAMGVLFSPWSYGLFWLTIWLIVFEFGCYIMTGKMRDDTRMVDYPDGLYYAWVRLGVLCAAYSGYIVGMVVVNRDPIN